MTFVNTVDPYLNWRSKREHETWATVRTRLSRTPRARARCLTHYSGHTVIGFLNCYFEIGILM